MKEMRAFIRPERLDAVIRSLELAGVHRMIVSDVLAVGDVCDPEHVRLALRFPHRYMPVTTIEILCSDEEVETFVRLIQKEGSTTYEDDGVVIVCDAGRVISIHSEPSRDDGTRSPDAP